MFLPFCVHLKHYIFSPFSSASLSASPFLFLLLRKTHYCVSLLYYSFSIEGFCHTTAVTCINIARKESVFFVVMRNLKTYQLIICFLFVKELVCSLLTKFYFPDPVSYLFLSHFRHVFISSCLWKCVPAAINHY